MLPLLACAFAAPVCMLCPMHGGSGKAIVGYAPNFRDLPSYMDKIDFSKLTHIDIAFENPVNDSGDLSFNPADAALIEKAHANSVKVLVSIGGGAVSEDEKENALYFQLQSDAKRASFVGKLADYVSEHNFDGLDVDLEGPSIGKNYGSFVDDLAKALHSRGKLITAALSAWYGGDSVPKSALDAFDFVNIMAYDNTGPWAPNSPGQHSSMADTIRAVNYWLGRGLAKNKAVLGVPFYGYGFGKAFRADGYNYAEIVNTYPGAENEDQVGDTIYYNGASTIKAKAKYVIDHGLAGVMVWSLDADAPGAKSLLSVIYSELNP